MINEDIAAEYVFAIKEGIKQKKKLKFQDWLISTLNNQEAEDSRSEIHNLNPMDKYTTDGL